MRLLHLRQKPELRDQPPASLMDFLNNMQNIHNTTKKGFTLVELVLVIAIIALLSTIILASLTKATSLGRDARRRGDLDAVATALELYYQDNGSYPTGSCLSSSWWNCWGSAGETRLLPASYIPKMPQDPTFSDTGGACGTQGGDASELYSYYSDGYNYILTTHLENPVSSSDSHYYNGKPYTCTASGNWAIKNGLQ